MTPLGYERVGGVLVLAEARSWLDALGLTSVDGAFARPGQQRRAQGKSLARLAAPDGSTVFVKRWDYNRPGLWLRAAIKLNFPVYSGPRELSNLLALREAGLRVPVPLAAGDVDRGARRRSFVALGELKGESLDLLPEPKSPAERRARIREVAALVRALHSAGFWHKDLYACNLFWHAAGGLGLLDCERVERRAAGPPLRWRVKDLAALNYSTSWPSRSERIGFLRAYLGIERLLPDTKRLALAVVHKTRRIARQGAKH